MSGDLFEAAMEECLHNIAQQMMDQGTLVVMKPTKIIIQPALYRRAKLSLFPWIARSVRAKYLRRRK